MHEVASASRMRNLSGSVLSEMLKVTERPEVISFGGGMPSPDALPAKKLAELAEELLSSVGPQVLQYGATEGYGPLRELVADRLIKRGINTTKERVLITSGAQQGLDLVTKILIDPADFVLVEKPTYLAAISVFESYQARFGFVDSDENGIIPESFEAAIKRHKPKMLYVVPTFQNPTGTTLSLERRKAIAEIAGKHEVVVLEDDPYEALAFNGEHLPPIASFDEHGVVVFLGSFSKVLSPGLRVGYATAQPGIFAKLAIGKQALDLHSANLSQRLVYEFCKRGYLEPHVEETIQSYRVKRDAMVAELRKHFPPEAKFTVPNGGLFIWVELPESVDTTELLVKAAQNNVAFIPGTSFYADGSGRNTMRLNFTNASPEQMVRGIRQLGATIAEALA